MIAASSSILLVLALTLNHAAGQSTAPAPGGQNFTIEDPGESITLSLPPGSSEDPADLSTADGATVAAAAIPILALDETVFGMVGLVHLLQI